MDRDLWLRYRKLLQQCFEAEVSGGQFVWVVGVGGGWRVVGTGWRVGEESLSCTLSLVARALTWPVVAVSSMPMTLTLTMSL